MKESSFEGVGGLKIFTRNWQPEGAPRGVMVIVHGFNSHSGQYLWAADQFVGNGLAVYALDLRGRGKSEGERFFIEKFEDYVNDVAKFIDIVKSESLICRYSCSDTARAALFRQFTRSIIKVRLTD